MTRQLDRSISNEKLVAYINDHQHMRSPAFQFYANDWLSSTQIAMMDATATGIYINLLAHCWNSPDCGIPDNDQALARLSKTDEQTFNKCSQFVRSCFFVCGDKIYNRRLALERKKQIENSIERQRAGKASGKSRRRRKLPQRTNVQQMPNKRSTNDEQNVNSSISSSSSSDSVSNETRSLHQAMANYLKEKILEAGTEGKITDAKVAKWPNHFRLMMERDGRTKEQIKAKINAVFEDPFWRTTIRSAEKLRLRWNEGKLDAAGKPAPKQTTTHNGQKLRTIDMEEYNRLDARGTR